MRHISTAVFVLVVCCCFGSTASAGEVCGGLAGLTCPEGQFCKFPPDSCQVPDLVGVCQDQPVLCPLVYDPVCGCDGNTYSNECEADKAGVAVDHAGICITACGGLAGLTCPEGQFCKFPPDSCQVPDLVGVCEEQPVLCPLVYDPVCGCDGNSYSNECEADKAGVAVHHAGPCGGAVPAVSTWGIVSLVLVLLAAFRIKFGALKSLGKAS